MGHTKSGAVKVICPYCGKKAKLIDSAELYGRSYGYGYYCKEDDAYVGCHPGTKKPLGIPADNTTRQMRKEAHNAFNALWHGGWFSNRTEAYGWLASKLDIPYAAAHIGSFDVEMCRKVIDLVKGLAKERSIAV